MNKQMRKFLLWFAHEHVEFRAPEIESILNVFKISPAILKTIEQSPNHPYWIVETNSESTIRRIASRSVSLRFCIEIWARENQSNILHDTLKKLPKEKLNEHIGNGKSFKIIVETFCGHITQKEKIDRIESFSYLPLDGPVKLTDPDTTLYYIEHYGMEPNNISKEPQEFFFGRWIANGQRELIQKLSLKTRKFIGTTSMDPQLSLMMANQAQVKNGDIILDPFVGTGSLLVAASQFGGFIMGNDIDYMMLHARTRPTRINQKKRSSDESVAANMKQYGKESQYIDVVVADFSRPLWRPGMRVDAIITDPPYGVREATERVGSAKLNPQIDEHQAATHIPSKIDYNLPHMFKDIFNFAAQHLEINGRLVCWFPVYRDNYSPDQLPIHPCMKLTANSEQILSNHASRRLLTYIKIREPKNCDVMDSTNILDFREMYFALRDETRREKRARQNAERAKNKADWEQRCREKTESTER